MGNTPESRKDATQNKKRILSVEIRYKEDTSPDASYLEQEGLGFEDRLEAYFGGEEDNRHMYDRIHKPRLRSDKTAVIGVRERGGKTYAAVTESIGGQALRSVVRENVVSGTRVMTDESSAYISLPKEGFKHEAVKHIAGQYVRGDAHTNGIESVWAIMKRGMHGVYHKASKKHMGRYVDEFTFRLNEGNVGRHTLDRLDSLVSAVAGKRITYKEMTA